MFANNTPLPFCRSGEDEDAEASGEIAEFDQNRELAQVIACDALSFLGCSPSLSYMQTLVCLNVQWTDARVLVNVIPFL